MGAPSLTWHNICYHNLVKLEINIPAKPSKDDEIKALQRLTADLPDSYLKCWLRACVPEFAHAIRSDIIPFDLDPETVAARIHATAKEVMNNANASAAKTLLEAKCEAERQRLIAQDYRRRAADALRSALRDLER
jgi:hypothetical protein